MNRSNSVDSRIINSTNIVVVLLGGIVCLIYLLTRSAHLSISHDSIFYFHGVANGSFNTGFHPHHLLFQPFMVLCIKALQTFGYNAPMMLLIETVNAIIGAIGSIVIVKILSTRFNVSIWWSAITTAVAVFSFGYWYHSICVEVVIIPAVLFLVSLYFGLDSSQRPSSKIWSAIFHGLSILFHQVYVFQGITMLVIAWMKDDNIKERLSNTKLYLLSSVPIVLIVYGLVIVYDLKPTSSTQVVKWLTAYAYIDTEANTHFNPPSLRTPLEIAVGETRALVGLLTITKSDVGNTLVKKAFPSKHFEDEEYLTRSMSSTTAGFVLFFSVLICLVFLLLFIVTTFGTLKTASRLDNGVKSNSIILLVAILIFTLFFSVWDTFNVEFWVLQTTLAWMVIGVYFYHNFSNKKYKMLITLFVVASIFFTNYVGAFALIVNPHSDYYRTLCSSIDEIAAENSKGALVILEDSFPHVMYMQIFSKNRPLCIYEIKTEAHKADSTFAYHRFAVDSTLKNGGTVICTSKSFDIDSKTAYKINAIALVGEERLRAEIDSLYSPYKQRMTQVKSKSGFEFLVIK